MFAPLLAVVAVGLVYSDSIKDVLMYYGLRIKGDKVVHILTSLAIPLTIYLVGAAYTVVAGIQLVNPAEYLVKSGLLPLRPTLTLFRLAYWLELYSTEYL